MPTPFSGLAVASLLWVASAAGQPVPQPFPAPAERRVQEEPLPPPVETPAAAADAGGETPTETTLGLPIFPGAQFLISYDAGRGQRYYLFGTNSSFAELVAYYKGALSQRGELVFDEPAVHMFEVGRFREETMAFPPGVTIKDYTWNNSPGYLNPKRGGQPARFRTIIQVVPVPPVR